MSQTTVHQILDAMSTPTKINRDIAAEKIVATPGGLDALVDLVFEVTNKKSIKAAWVLEWICKYNSLDYIVPYLDVFTKNIHKLQLDSAIRPAAKICELLATTYCDPSKNKMQTKVSKTHIDLIVETGFDWLMSPQKIAVRAYTMTALYYFGLNRAWIHPELTHLIRTKIIHESKGCKARGRKILTLIEKHAN